MRRRRPPSPAVPAAPAAGDAREIATQDPRQQDDEPSTGHNKEEKAQIEDELSQAKDERTKLQQEIGAMKREAEQSWAAERVENALLRERINDIAAEIARLTVALEGNEFADRGDAGERAGRRQRRRIRQRRAQSRALAAKAKAISPIASARCN